MNTQRTRAWPWLVDMAVILYTTLVCHALAVRVSTFRALFSSLGAQLPDATSLVFRVCTPRNLYILAAVISVVLIVKDLLVKSAVAKLGISVVAVLFLSGALVFVNAELMRPIHPASEILK